MTRDLSPYIADIAHHLFGEHNRKLSTRRQLRFGNNGSIAIEIDGPKRGTWYDHEKQEGGSPWDLLRRKLGLDDAEIPSWLEREFGIGSSREPNGSARSEQQIVATYDYRDEQGGLLFQVVRRHPRTFLQRRPDGKGGWAWSTKGVRMVPYCLPELFAAAAKRNGHPPRVFIVEGEKDADRLKSQWGLLATTYPLGAGKWRSDYNKYFSGFDVIILPDNDDVGRKHALKVATNLYRVAANIRILELPGLPSKGDISDWLDSDASQDDFETLVDGCPAFEPIASIPADDDETLVDSF